MYKSVFTLFVLFVCFTIMANGSNKVSITKQSQYNIYLGNFECQDSLNAGLFQNCWFTLSRSKERVEGVEIFIDGGMPAHEHGLPTAPKIVWSAKENIYLIKGLKFSMPGQWVLNFKVNAEDDALKDQIKMLIEVD